MENSSIRLQEKDIFHNRYQILSLLGEGGMGRVYLAGDLRLKGKKWAIKEIIVKQNSYQQFIDEAKLLVSLKHPYLPNIIDYYPPDKNNYSYLVMDYIPGTTLLKLFEASAMQLAEEGILKYLLQLCDLFNYLHNQLPTPIIYRDLKPANIMIDDEDNVRLVDFGIARNFKEGKGKDTIQMGTVGFAAPEQFENRQTDHRTDIYSLGALMYFLLSHGQYYYPSMKPINLIRNDLSHDLIWVIKRMLMSNPDERYQNIKEVKQELEKIANQLDVTEELAISKKELKHRDNSSFQEIYLNIPPKLIVTINLSKRAGSTFIALNLAKALVDFKIIVSIIEPPFEPYLFDYIGLEQRLYQADYLGDINFKSLPHLIYENQRLERDKETIQEGIIWLVADPRRPLIERDKWTYNHMTKLMFSSRKSSISILDVGSNSQHKSLEPILDSADLILVVIDPFPIEIMTNSQRLNELIKAKNKGAPIEFLINRFTTGIEKRELFSAIEVNPIAIIPAIDLSIIHKAVYSCNVPYSYPEVKSKLYEPFYQIIKQIIPPEILLKNKKSSKKLSWLNKLI